MSFRNSAIIRVCIAIMRSHRIVQNRGKKIHLPFLLMYITCVFMAFGGVSERFLRVLASLYSSSKLHMERVHIGPILSLQSWSIRHYTTEKLRMRRSRCREKHHKLQTRNSESSRQIITPDVKQNRRERDLPQKEKKNPFL